uniref:Uncharacterized protein n=1 Tax=Xiphophorus maculatus TaxID=8083 RepID=A0A3B5QWS4_XIPMA
MTCAVTCAERNECCSTSPHKPAASPQKPAILPHKPAASSQKPAILPQKPAASSQKPAILPQKPAASSQKPAILPQKPAASPQKPALQPQQCLATVVSECVCLKLLKEYQQARNRPKDSKGKVLPIPQSIVQTYCHFKQLLEDSRPIQDQTNLLLVTINNTTVCAW